MSVSSLLTQWFFLPFLHPQKKSKQFSKMTSKQKRLVPQLIQIDLQLKVSSVQVTGRSTQVLVFTCLSYMNDYSPIQFSSPLKKCTVTVSTCHCVFLALLRGSDTDLCATLSWNDVPVLSQGTEGKYVFPNIKSWCSLLENTEGLIRTSNDLACDLRCR